MSGDPYALMTPVQVLPSQPVLQPQTQVVQPFANPYGNQFAGQHGGVPNPNVSYPSNQFNQILAQQPPVQAAPQHGYLDGSMEVGNQGEGTLGAEVRQTLCGVEAQAGYNLGDTDQPGWSSELGLFNASGAIDGCNQQATLEASLMNVGVNHQSASGVNQGLNVHLLEAGGGMGATNEAFGNVGRVGYYANNDNAVNQRNWELEAGLSYGWRAGDGPAITPVLHDENRNGQPSAGFNFESSGGPVHVYVNGSSEAAGGMVEEAQSLGQWASQTAAGLTGHAIDHGVPGGQSNAPLFHYLNGFKGRNW